MELEDIKQELKSSVAGRFNSPLLGAFLVSWVAWNHRTIFVLFSDLTINARFHYIDEKIYATLTSFLILNFIGPLASTVAYIFILPLPTEWVHRWNLYRKRRLKEAELASEGKRLLTEEEGGVLKTKVDQLKGKLDEKRSELATATRKMHAMAMRLLDGLDENSSQSVLYKYLTSQDFLIDNAHLGEGPTIWKFKHSGEVEIPNYPGTTQYRIRRGKVYIIDPELNNDGVGELEFNNDFYCFVGSVVAIGLIRLRGVAQSTDFDLT